MTITHQPTITQIRYLFEQFGYQHYDEICTQYSHAAQCAGLALQQKLSADTVVAAFLHDIGHLIAQQQNLTMTKQGYVNHCELGAIFLKENNFNDAVVAMVSQHVQAKRYLVAKNAGYEQTLSPASTLTLQQQGGPLSLQQANQFAAQPYFEEILQLRELDDCAKDPNMHIEPLSFWLDYLDNYLIS